MWSGYALGPELAKNRNFLTRYRYSLPLLLSNDHVLESTTNYLVLYISCLSNSIKPA
jgi:hypothetical protein